MKRRRFLNSLLSIVGLFFGIAGCAAQKPITQATVHQTITTAIADAGTVAILAEQQYQSGTIPQTATNRTLINDLGNAYNKAKDIYSDVLAAEAAANSATQAQLAACTPSSANATSCISATQSASAAQAALTQKNSTLETTVNALVTKTSSVKAIAKP